MTRYYLLGKISKKVKERIRYFPKQKTIKINNSYKMRLNPCEEGIDRDLFIYKKREPLATDYLIQSGILKKGVNTLEAGANIGYYALLEWRLVQPTGTIYAAEPVTTNFKNLVYNINLNKPNRILPFKVAFGEKEGESTIYLSKLSNWCTLNKENIQHQIGSETVRVTTIDKFCENKDRINFIRMDVEGYEYEILKGATKTLRKNINIQMEVHPLSIKNLNDFLDILKQNNFFIKYAVFEYQVPYNHLTYSAFRKDGSPYPLQFYSIEISKLRKLMEDNPSYCPNVFLSKKNTTSN
jgi:FkbM family methyltransferase